MRTAAYLQRRTPHSGNPNHKTPIEMITKQKPDLSNLRAIGCVAYIHTGQKATKDRALIGQLIGYSTDSNTYRIKLQTGAIYESASVRFDETRFQLDRVATQPSMEEPFIAPSMPTYTTFPMIPPQSHLSEAMRTLSPTSASLSEPTDSLPSPSLEPPPTANHDLTEANGGDSPDGSVIEAPRGFNRPRRVTRPPDRLNLANFHQRLQTYHANRVALVAMSNKATPLKPESGSISHRDAKKIKEFQDAMKAEINQLMEMGALRIVDRPPGIKEQSSIWVHKRKFDANGKFIKAKSRLTIRGDLMTPGLDYDVSNTPSPTPHLSTIMLFLALVNQLDLETRQYDVTGAYPLAPRRGDNHLYMKFPDGMKPIQGKTLEVGNLYGHPEAALNWNIHLDHILQKFNFRRTLSDSTLYIKWINEHDFIMLCAYVDDFRVAATTSKLLEEFDEFIKAALPVTVQDEETFLGMNIIRNRAQGTTTILQTKYIEELLTKYGMADCKPCPTPAIAGMKLVREDIELHEQDKDFPFAEAVGALLWIARCSHPEIHYAVNQLGSQVLYPSSIKIKALKRVLRYLQGAKDIGIKFKRNMDAQGHPMINLLAYSDASYGEEPEGNEHPLRSTTGYVIFIQGVGPIAAKTELQSTIAQSTAEAEYIALAETAKCIVHLRNLLAELKFTQMVPTIIFEDNQAAIAMSQNKITSSKTKHIKIKFHYIKELVQDNDITLAYCPTEEQIADILTKALSQEKFIPLRNRLLNLD